MKPTETNPTLHFWDVAAALLGFALMGVLRSIDIWQGYGIIWLGAPLAAVFLRRKFLPMLTPSDTEAAIPLSPSRKLGASVLSVAGGLIAMLAATMVYVVMRVGRDELAWLFLLPLAVGGVMATIGLRRLTHPGSGAPATLTAPAPSPTRKAHGQADRKT